MSLNNSKNNGQLSVAKSNLFTLISILKLLLYKLTIVAKIQKHNFFLVDLSKKRIL